MLLNLVWERASGSKTLERKSRAERFRESTPAFKVEAEKKPRPGFLESLEKLLSAHVDLILRDLDD